MSKKKKLADYPPSGPSFGAAYEDPSESLGDGTARVTIEHDTTVFSDAKAFEAIAAAVAVLES